jgi:hypothetical protein
MDLACQGCGSLEGDGVMLTCDDCNEGWHMQCLPSKMRSAPDSSWYCPFCAAVRADEDVVQLPRPTSGTFSIMKEHSKIGRRLYHRLNFSLGNNHLGVFSFRIRYQMWHTNARLVAVIDAFSVIDSEPCSDVAKVPT